jgi:hypothetical protein
MAVRALFLAARRVRGARAYSHGVGLLSMQGSARLDGEIVITAAFDAQCEEQAHKVPRELSGKPDERLQGGHNIQKW